MIRLLIVLAIVVLATLYLNGRDRELQKPEQQYMEQTGKAKVLEQQMQEQAAQQLRNIDENTR
ncbi:MAG: hypothetical protein IPG20_06810 [Gammaproteobacteria bacterium]|nr:hypothetical protein [Gammaproteobacteria bacterium]